MPLSKFSFFFFFNRDFPMYISICTIAMNDYNITEQLRLITEAVEHTRHMITSS